MNDYEPTSSRDTYAESRTRKALAEVSGLLRAPYRVGPLFFKLASEQLRTKFERENLYSYTTTTRPTVDALQAVVRWIAEAQRPDGGIAAYYSLLGGYSNSYAEVTGYIVPTLYDFAGLTGDQNACRVAQDATAWLLSVQMPSGAFPGGVASRDPQSSVFNTGQILQGLVRAYREKNDAETRNRAIAAGNWLTSVQQPDGSWAGPGAYQGVAHTYYSMVSWALAQLSESVGNDRYGVVAERNLDWVLSRATPGGWFDDISLQGHPTYLHFIAYVIQGVLECGILRRRNDAIQAAAKSAWVLLRKFETSKRLLGAYERDFKTGLKFTCLTGNAQMSCVWLRLFEVTNDLRYLNAALKMNEMLKQSIELRGRRGVAGGVAGSYPIWGAYQPLRYISWGCKFLADALMLELRLTKWFEAIECAS